MLALDLGNDFPLEKALPNAVFAVELGREIGLDGEELSDGLLRGPTPLPRLHGVSHELAQYLGVDELAGRSAYAPIGNDAITAMKTTMTTLGRGTGAVTRTRAVLKLAFGGKSLLQTGWLTDCEAAGRMAGRDL